MTSILSTLLFLAQTDTETTVSPAGAAGGALGGVIGLVVAVVMIASMWKIFTKAGQPGWAAIIPIFNLYILCKVAGRPGWWVLLMLIPFVNFIIAIILLIDLAKASASDSACFSSASSFSRSSPLAARNTSAVRQQPRPFNYGSVQRGTRFSLKAAMPSLASGDSRASR